MKDTEKTENDAGAGIVPSNVDELTQQDIRDIRAMVGQLAKDRADWEARLTGQGSQTRGPRNQETAQASHGIHRSPTTERGHDVVREDT